MKILFVTLFLSASVLNVSTLFTKVWHEGKIVGGQSCSLATNPFMVSLKYIFGLRHICGGSLINENWVLTAAHCVENQRTQPRTIIVVAGIVDDRQWSEVDRIVVHEEYNHPTFLANDVALLSLYTPVAQSTSIGFVHLPSRIYGGDLDLKCRDSRVMGWGDQTPKPAQPKPSFHKPNNTQLSRRYRNPNLQCGRVRVLSQFLCKKLYPDPIQDTAICAEEIRGSPCHGDSGGPLICDDTQYGIVSAGHGCAQGFPVIYTRVDKYLSFIGDTVSASAKNQSMLCLALIAALFIFLL